MLMRTLAIGFLVVFDAPSAASAQPVRPTGSMHVARAGHAAVLLHDGRVLVVGGSASDEACRRNAVAELYNPSTGTWSLSGEMPILIGSHVASVLLGTGQILVSGGDACGESARGAIVFDPTAGTWKASDMVLPATPDAVDAGDLSAINVLPIARTEYTATRLRNGSVLVAGGGDAVGRTRTAEIFVPEIAYESVHSGGLHPGNFMGKPWGIATNSKGHAFMSECSLPDCRRTHLFEWTPPAEPMSYGGVLDSRRRYLKEIGQELDGMAHAVRVDRDGNIWEVNQETNTVVKFSPDGQTLMQFFKPAEPPNGADGAPLPLAPEYVFGRPTDIAWDAGDNLFVSDAGKARLVKYAKDGHYITAVGSLGTAPGQMDNPHSIAADAVGNVYVADHGNSRIQVFDDNLALRAVYDGIGRPWAVCITPGPHPYLYSSSNFETNLEHGSEKVGEVYKMELDGTIVGRFGRADNPQGVFPTLHAIDCAQQNQINAVGGAIAYIIRVQP